MLSNALVAPILTTALLLQTPPAPDTPGVIHAEQFPTLQAAIDTLPDTGGIVRIPPGTTEIDKPIVISTPETRITGSGASSHIKNTNSEGQPAFILRPQNLAEDKQAKLWRVQLDNFRISGNENSGHGIQAESINELAILAMSIDHHGIHGISMVDCYEDPRISNSIITYNKQAGLYLQGNHDIVVSANQFEENQDALICVDGFNLCMNGNNIDDHLRHGVVIENTYGSVLSGNMIEECKGTGVILDRDCYGITISANVIAHEMGGGIDLKDANGCAISANTFVLVHDFSVRVGKGSERLTIAANNFSNSHIGEEKIKRPTTAKQIHQIDTASGVVLNAAQHVTITSNSFSGLAKHAVLGDQDCTGILCTNNLVTDWGRDLPDDDAPAFQLPQEHNQIRDNLITSDKTSTTE